MPYCYYHLSLHRAQKPAPATDKKPIVLPSLEDSKGIHIALHHVLGAMSSSQIDQRSTSLYLRGIRIAAELVPKSTSGSSLESVRDLCCDDNGDSLAPETTTCEPPDDCLDCKERDDCDLFEDYKDEVEEFEKDMETKES